VVHEAAEAGVDHISVMIEVDAPHGTRSGGPCKSSGLLALRRSVLYLLLSASTMVVVDLKVCNGCYDGKIDEGVRATAT
jgi:hypothetical protein